MSEYLTDVKIGKVYPGKTGTSEYGEWQAWNFYIDGMPDLKLSYFSGGKKSPPVEGASVKFIEYDIVTKGEYTNNNVKTMNLSSASQQAAPKQDGPPDDYEPPGNLPKGLKMIIPPPSPPKEASFYISYAKDIQVAMMENAMTPPGLTLDELCQEVVTVGLKMLKGVTG